MYILEAILHENALYQTLFQSARFTFGIAAFMPSEEATVKKGIETDKQVISIMASF